MPKLINAPILLCDACGFEEPVERVGNHLVGVTCFVCEEVMFTPADLRAYRRAMIWQRLSNILLWLFPGRLDARVTKVKLRDGRVVYGDFDD